LYFAPNQKRIEKEKGVSIMFQAELGRMMRDEQQKDYVREARRINQAARDNPPHRITVPGVLVLPLILVSVVSRLIVFSAHAIRH
jgi:hypothetical protein